MTPQMILVPVLAAKLLDRVLANPPAYLFGSVLAVMVVGIALTFGKRLSKDPA